MAYEFLFAAPFAAAALGAVMLYRYDRPDARVKRALRRTRASTIAAARDGEVVKIVGTVRYGERTLESPLTGRTCAFYSVLVENTGRNPSPEVAREDAGVDFYVEDGSGVALVRLAEVAPKAAIDRDREFITTPLDSDEVIERFMTPRGHSMRGFLLYKSLRAAEGIVAAGTRIAVLGLARWLADPDVAGGSYRESPQRLVLEGSAASPLFLSDHPSVVR